jgi:cysteine-rich repeat protein
MGVRPWVLVLAALLAASVARAWKVDITSPGAAHAVATTADGDVIAAGLFDTGAGNEIIVVRLAASGDSERWRTEIPDTVNPASRVLLTLDAAGDVLLATGFDTNPTSLAQAIKLAGDTGAIRWTHDLSAFPFAIRTDDANDVYVARQGLTVTKLSGATGEPEWTFEQAVTYPGTANLAILESQDPVLVGSIPAALPGVAAPSGVVIRLDRTTGLAVWSQPLSYEQGVPTRIASAGDDVFVGGAVLGGYPIGSTSYGVALTLSATTGDVRWTRALQFFGAVGDIAVTPTGDVAVAGVDRIVNLFPITTNLHTLVLARADGAVLTQGSVPPPSSCWMCSSDASLTTLVADASGDLSIVGSFHSNVVVARLAAPDLHLAWRRDGGDFPVVPGHFGGGTAVAGAAGAVVVAGIGNLYVPNTLRQFTVLSFDASGALRACGDDTVDPGEACDDGNLDASDCCAADCSAAEPDGTPCTDGSLCTIDDRCAAGRCEGGGPLPCEPCGECHSASGCFVETSSGGCGQSTITNGSQITIARPRRGSDRFAWSLRSGPATAKTDFGNPLDATGYALCASTPNGKLVLRAVAPAGACSRRRPCWRSTRAGFEYVDPGAPEGLAHLSLRAGAAGKTTLAAGGAHAILFAPLPLDEELYVELRRLDDPATCWSATLPQVTKNSARKFRAKGR